MLFLGALLSRLLSLEKEGAMANPFETQDKRGRPRVKVSREEVERLKAQGLSFRQIGRKLGVGASTAHKVLRNGSVPRS